MASGIQTRGDLWPEEQALARHIPRSPLYQPARGQGLGLSQGREGGGEGGRVEGALACCKAWLGLWGGGTVTCWQRRVRATREEETHRVPWQGHRRIPSRLQLCRRRETNLADQRDTAVKTPKWDAKMWKKKNREVCGFGVPLLICTRQGKMGECHAPDGLSAGTGGRGSA